MTVRITKPEINFREKISELDFDKVPYDKMPYGSIIQVTAGETEYRTATSSSSYTPTDMYATITPRFASSKIFITLGGDANNNGTAYTESAGVNYIINNENLVHPYRDLVDVKIIGTYIYLDAEDRKRIAQSEHKILITQHQHRECFLGSGTNHSTRAINLDFNHLKNI